MTEVRSEGYLNFKMKIFALPAFVLLLFAPAAGICPQNSEPETELLVLKWEKDFELILELNDVPDKGTVKFKKEKASLEGERQLLIERKESLEKRLELLSAAYSSEELYEEMLEEETTDLSSTKESISKKLEVVKEKLNETEYRLKRLKSEHRK